MKRKRTLSHKRLIGYSAGFILFYAPFALVQRILALFLNTGGKQDIHDACFRCGLLGMTGSIKMDLLSARFIMTFLLLASAFLFGPVYCRLFCTAGAVTEYLSKLVPDRLKVNWQRMINPSPVKYGMLFGYLLSPFFGFSVACSYCNYSIFQRITNSLGSMDIGVLSSTNIITIFIWIFVFGLFSKGGRGFCSYFCPVGAAQNLVYGIGRRLGIASRLVFTAEQCTSCGMCAEKCPMGAIQKRQEGMVYNMHNCITCGQCVQICPNHALLFAAHDKNNAGVSRPLKIDGGGNEKEIR